VTIYRRWFYASCSQCPA